MSSYAIEFRWRMRSEPWFTELKNRTGKNHTGLGSAELLLLPPQPKKLGIHRMPPTFPITFSSAIPCQFLPLPSSLFSPLLFVLLPIISIFSLCGLLLHQIFWCLWSHKVLLSQMNLSDNSWFPAVLPTPKCIRLALGDYSYWCGVYIHGQACAHPCQINPGAVSCLQEVSATKFQGLECRDTQKEVLCFAGIMKFSSSPLRIQWVCVATQAFCVKKNHFCIFRRLAFNSALSPLQRFSNQETFSES